MTTTRRTPHPQVSALTLRVGLGLVFAIGGWNKLQQLLDPAREAGILAVYTSPHGYINEFFAQYLFTGRFGDWLTPWAFLTTLSAFELVTGLMLVAGLLVRPIALIWALMLWTFVMALPVVTATGVSIEAATFTAPAMLVQIRDIGLSGLALVIYNLGSGAISLDHRLARSDPQRPAPDWNALGLLLRLSVALPLIVGGAFAGLAGIQSFDTSGWLLLPLGLLLASGVNTRVLGVVVAGVLLWYLGGKLSLDATLIANLNGIKRELAYLAGAAVLAVAGAGNKFTLSLPNMSFRVWPRQGLPSTPSRSH